MLQRAERLADRFGPDHSANLWQHLNARQQEVAITINDRAKLLFESGGLFRRIGQGSCRIDGDQDIPAPRAARSRPSASDWPKGYIRRRLH